MHTIKRLNDKRENGFTLIELLIAIVVVGILTAVAIVGIGGLTNDGKGASCQATMDAARAAEAVHYANSGNQSYPTTFSQMTGTTPPELQLAGGVTANLASTAISANGWTITLGANGALTSAGSPQPCV